MFLLTGNQYLCLLAVGHISACRHIKILFLKSAFSASKRRYGTPHQKYVPMVSCHKRKQLFPEGIRTQDQGIITIYTYCQSYKVQILRLKH